MSERAGIKTRDCCTANVHPDYDISKVGQSFDHYYIGKRDGKYVEPYEACGQILMRKKGGRLGMIVYCPVHGEMNC